MKNKYEIRGEVTAIFLRRMDGSVFETLIDTTDLQLVNEFSGTWYAHWAHNTKSFYAMGNLRISKTKRTSVQLHRWILQPPKHFVVDHINHDTLDNRRSNLRAIPNQYNTHNKNPANIRGIRGVYWSEAHKKWRAVGTINAKHHHIGLFRDIREAEKAVTEWRRRHMPYSEMDKKGVAHWK